MYSDFRVKLEHKRDYSTGRVQKIIVLTDEMSRREAAEIVAKNNFVF